ncbi:MAG: hypothetical protein NTY35_15150 [Planctomycetota bacterium]|nr:hypothetical protein [Planctomycetota bacterium]
MRIHLAFAFACLLAPTLVAGEQPKLDHQKIGKDFATRLAIDTSRPEDITLEGVFAKHYVHADLGAFHVQWPIAELPSRAKEFKECCEALVKCQETWLDWVQLKASEQKAVRADLALVLKWVQGWSVQVLAKGKGGQDAFQMVPPQPTAAEAYKRFNDALQRLTPIGPGREQPAQVKLVFAPSRQDFAEFVYFAGWVLPDMRPALWLDNVPDWTQCFVKDMQVIGLQYSINGRPPQDYTSGTWMNERDPDVMQQQVTQLAMNALFLDHYKDRVPGAFVSGLSMNLVVDTYGVVNTRVDGDTRSKETAKREVFIPGGASDGGFLAKNSADTRWRENHGSDHFLPTLRTAQSEGGDEAKNDKNKAACFAVRNDAGGAKYVVRAPFLGSAAAETKPPPADFNGDWAEFLRAYKSGFIHWLQTVAGGNEKVSRERFATLLRKLADPNLTTDFEAVFQEVYQGAPLSNADVDKNCLEGQFLRWLPKSK